MHLKKNPKNKYNFTAVSHLKALPPFYVSNLLFREKKSIPLNRRRRSFLLINQLLLTPAVEGQPLLWILEGIKGGPLFSPDDDHTGDDTNHSGGVKEICEHTIEKELGRDVRFSQFLCITSICLRGSVCWFFF